MAGGISDSIEQFIKELLRARQDQVELQRNELAAQFRCAPSQINYVLSTRFTADHGYRIESRRGGGGYVRIVRIDVDMVYKLKAIAENIAQSMTDKETAEILLGLRRSGVITLREAMLIQVAMDEEALPGPEGARLRARMFKKVLLMLQSQQT